MISNFIQRQITKNTERPLNLSGEFLARYNFVSQKSSGKSVLDIGCGLGEGTRLIAESGALRVLGIDYSSATINIAREKYDLPNLDFQILLAEDIRDIEENFDIIVAFELIEHMKPGKVPNFLKAICEKISPNGTAYISTPNKFISSPDQDRPNNPFHQREYEPREFEEILQEYFEEIELFGLGCVSEKYKKTAQELQKKRINKIAFVIGKHKIVRQVLSFFPQSLKQKFTGENLLPALKKEDFVFCSEEINSAENLFAICRKPKSSADL